MGSLFLSQVIGIYLLVMGLMLLIHHERVKETMKQVAGNKALLTFQGVITLIIGLLIVCSHNQWGSVWEGIISLVGWIALIGGIIRLLIPAWGEKMVPSDSGKTFFIIAGVVALVFGVYLTYVGFFFTEVFVIDL